MIDLFLVDDSGRRPLFGGDARRALRAEPEPCSFPTGCEDLVQGYRRQLGEALRLGREVTAVAPRDGEAPIATLAEGDRVAAAGAAAA